MVVHMLCRGRTRTRSSTYVVHSASTYVVEGMNRDLETDTDSNSEMEDDTGKVEEEEEGEGRE